MDGKDWLLEVVRSAALERTLAAGETLFRSGDRTVGLYEVLKGKVQLARIDATGRETILYVAGAGDTIAEASLFSPTYHCDAVATANAVVRLYPKMAVLREFQRDPKAAQSFMAMLANQVMSLRTKLQQRDIRSARDRVRHYLALNVRADGRTVELPGTAKDFAAELGLTHEALYRALADMAADGEIERLKGRIRIVDVPPVRLRS
jgi:CRP-like cAMP-binding protein